MCLPTPFLRSLSVKEVKNENTVPPIFQLFISDEMEQIRLRLWKERESRNLEKEEEEKPSADEAPKTTFSAEDIEF